jgi:hypothetical protein
LHVCLKCGKENTDDARANIQNPFVYTQLVTFASDEYHVKTTKTLDEACELAEAGFEFFTIENIRVPKAQVGV